MFLIKLLARKKTQITVLQYKAKAKQKKNTS